MNEKIAARFVEDDEYNDCEESFFFLTTIRHCKQWSVRLSSGHGTILIVKRGNCGVAIIVRMILRCLSMVYIANDNLGLQKWDAICPTTK